MILTESLRIYIARKWLKNQEYKKLSNERQQTNHLDKSFKQTRFYHLLSINLVWSIMFGVIKRIWVKKKLSDLQNLVIVSYMLYKIILCLNLKRLFCQDCLEFYQKWKATIGGE
ncbi:MAG: hypothetical protein I3275_04410 [Candidatus Moeniiplasma glomeromycotorum]|nr:hypothetical protein [Candidatus Moeniiplasma glomeromycotorum]